LLDDGFYILPASKQVDTFNPSYSIQAYEKQKVSNETQNHHPITAKI